MNQNLSPRRRALSLLLALTLVLGLLPVPALAAEGAAPAGGAPANHWASSYLNQLIEWGFIRPDQAQEPDKELTRADFMAITNRAYGYHELGPTPFEDVSDTDWYYDDVGIAYTAGYIKGTSPTTAGPEEPLNRETATTILGRNMMLQESAGELLDFSDARDISTWARGTIKSSMEHYLVTGFDDGTFRPQRNISWGEIAALISRTIGTPLQDEGDYSLGGVFGNVTVTSPGVTLRDTVISGDLYITGGVGLGGIKLENVTVLGRIIASGTGSSEGGASILMRNVTADELLIDNLQDKEVSIQADGITEIGKTTVRSSAYIEDNTPDGLGLHMISFEGDYYGEDDEIPEGWAPPKLTLAGRVEEVVNRTPNSTVEAAKGTVAKLTVDETATDSQVIIDRGAVVKDLVLDTGVDVTGEGDIVKLEVNAPESTVAMLPDEIVIRPGITAIIAGEEMDSMSAEEFLLEPMILAGYPKARDIAPTSLEAVFSTNKKGRIYWAVSAITDGSIGAEDLLKPPSYGNKAVKWGTLDSPRGNEETVAQITGLVSNGSYYLSAVLEDQKGQLSPVKVISFTTPDNTVPAFCAGYPHMSSVGTGRNPSPDDDTRPGISQAVVMPTKDCKLYYALLPQSAQAPTENELRASAVSGALGYGVLDVYKNTETIFRVHDQILDEKATYTLYLWLVDADGVNKSAITSLTFTTDDETPPEFIVHPTVNQVQATSVGLTFRLNEDGTVYWVAVPAGTVYPKPEPGSGDETAPLTSDYAILQVASGMNLGSTGKSGRVAARENTDGTITVAGLLPESAYDFYYVAKDNAGPDRNYSVEVKKITINTLDTSGPKFTQRFSSYTGTDDTMDPRADTDIYLDVSENIRYTGKGGGEGFRELAESIAKGSKDAAEKLKTSLEGSIKLYRVAGAGQQDTEVKIDFGHKDIKVENRELGLRITIPGEALDPKLANGGQYYFTIENLSDTSNNQNPIVPNKIDFKNNRAASIAGGHSVDIFEIESATVLFDKVDPSSDPVVRTDQSGNAAVEGTLGTDRVTVDMSFRVRPQSTATALDNVTYDILLWAADYLSYDLYYRIIDASTGAVLVKEKADKSGYEYDDKDKPFLFPYNGTADQTKDNARTVDENGWMLLGNNGGVQTGSEQRANWSGKSLNVDFNKCAAARDFPLLNHLGQQYIYEFAVHLTYFGTSDDRTIWNGTADLYVNVIAGQGSVLNDLAGALRTSTFDEKTQGGLAGGASSIGRWPDGDETLDGRTLWNYRTFTDRRTPSFTNDAPTFDVGSTSVNIGHNLESDATVYYVIAEAKTDPDIENSPPRYPTFRKLTEDEKAELAATGGTIGGKPVVMRGGTYTDEIAVTLDGPNPPWPDGSSAYPMLPWMKGGTESVDNPDEDNLITNPTRLDILNQDRLPSTVAGKGSFKSGRGITTPQLVDNLKPNTDYYAYFVIKGEMDMPSHVYIYHFKTDPPQKPKITMTNNPEYNGANLGTHIDSKLDYLVFTLSDALDNIEILMRPFDAPFPDYYEDFATGVDKDGNPVFTLLDAMLIPYDVALARTSDNVRDGIVKLPINENNKEDVFDGYSVFDMFATGSMKSNMSNFLRKAATSKDYLESSKYVVNDGSVSLRGGVDLPQRLNRETAGVDYVIIAVARIPNPTSTTPADVDSYAATAPINLSTVGPPDITNVQTDITIGAGATTIGYDGTITITFDKIIYSDSRRTEFSRDDLRALGLWTPPGDSGLLSRIMPDCKKTGNRTTIQFTPISGESWLDNDSITYTAGVFRNINGVPQDNKQLKIEVKREGKGTNNEAVVVTVTWGNETKVERFPLNRTGSDLTIELKSTTADITLGGNYRDGYTLDLDASGGKVSAVIEATVIPSDATYIYQWSIPKEARQDIISITSGANTDTVTVSSEKIGETTLRLLVVETDGTPTTRDVKVTVKGTITLQESGEVKLVSGSTDQFTWDISGQANPSAVLQFKTSPAVGNAEPVLTCDNPSIRISNVRVNPEDSSIIEASVQYAGSSGNQSTSAIPLTLTVGKTVKAFTITIDSTNGSQSGVIIGGNMPGAFL